MKLSRIQELSAIHQSLVDDYTTLVASNKDHNRYAATSQLEEAIVNVAKEINKEFNNKELESKDPIVTKVSTPRNPDNDLQF
jgi:superfamily I DNA and RNA helicase